MSTLVKTYRTIFIIITIALAIMILNGSLSMNKKKSTGMMTMRRNENEFNYYVKNYVIDKLVSRGTEIEADCSKSRGNIVKQFRSLTGEYIKDSTDISNDIGTCALPPGIQDDERFIEMMRRVKSARAACRKNTPTELMGYIRSSSLYQDKTHHVMVCINSKVASGTMAHYTNVLHMFTVMDSYTKILKRIHTMQQFKNSPQPKLNGKDLSLRKTELAFPVVRHPFTRALSCYLSKVFQQINFKRDRPTLYKRMMEFSVMPTTEVTKIMDGILPGFQRKSFECIRPVKTREKLTLDTNPKTPSFRGFVLAITETFFKCKRQMNCLLAIDLHYQQQSVRCSTCKMEYDLIVKAETLQLDLLFIENLLDLPPINELHMELMREDARAKAVNGTQWRIHFTPRSKTYPQYMSELSRTEMDFLYTAYFPDFVSFSYDPCDDLELQE